MALTSGTKLGPYEIQSPLGAGGMGEVYRARDSRLGRHVALKVLPSLFSTDTERMDRFEREAQVLASLNHPHIASLYGLEDSDHIRALVMELVEGPTLADRIGHGAIAVDEALPIAKQICDAIEYAHERGIVHRDLKPANIKLSSDGSVKVLDFGLAKALEGDMAASDISNSPTLTRMATQQGVILGTAAYMSPEQAKGKSVDRRADIWAFGCILFEMLSGKMAFSGETATDTLAAIIKEEPHWSALPKGTPLRVAELLKRCLKKDSRQRLQSIGDGRVAIEEVLAADDASAPEPAATARVGRRQILPWGLFAFFALLAVVLAVSNFGHRSLAPASLRLTIEPPHDAQFGSALALSPDGTRLVFVATSKGKQTLWIRPLDSVQAEPIPGTEDGDFPFWSPDGRSIGFFANAKLKRLDFGNGSIRNLCDSGGSPRGAAWSPEGTIVFAPNVNTPLMKVPASGGTPVPASDFDPSGRERSHRWPYFLSDGRHFLFLREGNSEGQDALFIGSLDSTKTRLLLTLPYNSAAIYANDYLLYSIDGSLVAQPFDSEHLKLAGNPTRIAENVSAVGIQGPTGYVSVSASATGLLVYRTDVPMTSQFVVVDRSGKALRTIGPPGDYDEPSLSPDQKQVAFSKPDSGQSASSTPLWLMDIGTASIRRFTFDNVDAGSSIWSPDGRWIYFTRRSGEFNIYRKLADGSADAELVLKAPDIQKPSDISANGRFLLIEDFSPVSSRDLLYSPIPPAGEPKPFRATPAEEADGRFSPDGRWVAYCSDENRPGDFEVFVSSFPEGGSKWQVSSEGGFWPMWSNDGREIYFVSGANLMAAEVIPGPTFQFRPSRALFPVRLAQSVFTQSHSGYFVLSGGQRFLINQVVGDTDSVPITAMANWTSGLKQK